MDYIAILFLLLGISIITIFIVYYSYISKQIDNYIVPLMTSYNNTKNDRNVIQVNTFEKNVHETLDEQNIQTTKNSFLQIPYDFIKRNIMYYGKPIIHNSVDPFL